MKSNKLSFISSNWGYKLLALLLAGVLWIYVINSPDTERDKLLSDVPVSFTGEAAMNEERKLVISSDRGKALADIAVVATVNTVNYSALRPDNVRAYIDLSGVTTPGEHTLRVSASASAATVKSISPATVTIKVDELATRTIPIQQEFLGELAEGYWHSAVELVPSSIQLQGPLNDIESVKQAVCYIPLDGVSRSYNDSMRISLLDEKGAIIDSANFLGEIPNVTVKMQVLPKKLVPLDIAGALKGEPEDGYEKKSIEANPSHVEIAAPQETLDEIDSLSVDSINLNNATQSIIAISSIRKPYSDIVLLTYDSTEIYVEIGEKEDTTSFENIDIQLQNTGKKLSASTDVKKGNITLYGQLSKLSKLKRAGVELYVDLGAITEAGVYTLPVKARLPEGMDSLSTSIEPETIQLKVSDK